MKRLIATLFAVALTMGICAPAHAAEQGSITIENAVVGQDYAVYQVLDLESYDADSGAYSYKAATGWDGFIDDSRINNVYLSRNAQGYVTWVGEETDARVAAFAKLALAYAQQQGINPSSGPVTADSTTVTFQNLDLGYYLLDSTLGTFCSLDTTNPNVVMQEKNSEPSIYKEVQEDSTDLWGTINDADINQVIKYRATITVQKGAENYVMHDTMSAGLTYLQVDSVTTNGIAVATDNYTIETDTACGCTFEVAFSNAYIDSLEAGTEIVIEYSALLNENAVVGIEGNPNDVKLQYGDENKITYTPLITVVTYTWDAKVIKYTIRDGQEVMLAGATFKLSTDQDGQELIKFHALGDNHYEVCANPACVDEHVAEITTDSTGTFHIEGLDAGSYYLTEIQAPAGYNALAGPVELLITGATQNDGGELVYTTVEKKVENKTGTILPTTGGMGTTIIYVIGAALVIGAGVLLVTRRRASREK